MATTAKTTTKRTTRARNATATAKPTKTTVTKSRKPQAKTKAQPKKEVQPPKTIGVIAAIIEILREADAKAPLTKKQITEQLHQRFSEREFKALSRTVGCQVPSRLRSEKELDVQQQDNGYWLD